MPRINCDVCADKSMLKFLTSAGSVGGETYCTHRIGLLKARVKLYPKLNILKCGGRGRGNPPLPNLGYTCIQGYLFGGRQSCRII